MKDKDKLNHLKITTMTYRTEHYTKNGSMKKNYFSDYIEAQKYFIKIWKKGYESYLIEEETGKHLFGANY